MLEILTQYVCISLLRMHIQAVHTPAMPPCLEPIRCTCSRVLSTSRGQTNVAVSAPAQCRCLSRQDTMHASKMWYVAMPWLHQYDTSKPACERCAAATWILLCCWQALYERCMCRGTCAPASAPDTAFTTSASCKAFCKQHWLKARIAPNALGPAWQTPLCATACLRSALTNTAHACLLQLPRHG